MAEKQIEIQSPLSPEQVRQRATQIIESMNWKRTDSEGSSVAGKEKGYWQRESSGNPASIAVEVLEEEPEGLTPVRLRAYILGIAQGRRLSRILDVFAGQLAVDAEAVAGPGLATAGLQPGADVALNVALSKLHKRVTGYLSENLREGEAVRVLIVGASNQAIVGTDTRLFVIKPGWLAGATGGVEATSWSYRNINGIQTHKGLMTGAVIVQAPGQSGSSTSYWGSDKSDPFKAPNAIPIAGDWESVKAGVAELQELIDRAHEPAPSAPANGGAAASIAAEVKALAELHQAGALTDEEFAAAKRRLISDAS